MDPLVPNEAIMECSPDKIGVIEAAVNRHHPSEAVKFEACVLDRELIATERAWPVLFSSIESFYTHYPAILLRSVEAIEALGQVCLDGIRQAPGARSRIRSSSELVALMHAIAEEGVREGPEKVHRSVPEAMEKLVARLRSTQDVVEEHGELFSPLLVLGKQVLLIGEDGNPPEVWFSLLARITELALAIARIRVGGEPFYAGEWDEEPLASALDVDLLAAVRAGRIEEDLGWIEQLSHGLSNQTRPPVDVFLELSAWERRDQREAVWQTWFERLSAKVSAQGLPGRTLRTLCTGLAAWIRQVGDRRFLARLAAVLRQEAPAVAAANGELGLITALDTFGNAIHDRLGRESGRGEIDVALEDLRATVAEIVQRLVSSPDGSVVGRAVDEAVRLRTGPVIGAPVSRDDVIWRMELAARQPHVAEPLLMDLLAGFSLEDLLLRDGEYRACGSGPATVGEALCGLLGREWPDELVHVVRAVLRVTPLSPFHLGSPTVRAHLMALDPDDRHGSYLHDLKERILSRAGNDELLAMENVLRFWQTGDVSHLSNLAGPESLAGLPTQARLDHLEDIQEVLARLDKHAPAPDKQGVSWLAGLPDAFYDDHTLVKIAGFPGCSPAAIQLLVHFLEVYRYLVRKFETIEPASAPGGENLESLFERSALLMARRRELSSGFFKDRSMDGVKPADGLARFSDELEAAREDQGVLERLAFVTAGVLSREKLEITRRVLANMIAHASLSGLGGRIFIEAAEQLNRSSDGDGELPAMLRRIGGQCASIRNRLSERLHPCVKNSTRRLLQNPLARPASSYGELFEVNRPRGAERLGVMLGEILVDDILSADGGLLLLESYAHRLLHFVERY